MLCILTVNVCLQDISSCSYSEKAYDCMYVTFSRAHAHFLICDSSAYHMTDKMTFLFNI